MNLKDSQDQILKKNPLKQINVLNSHFVKAYKCSFVWIDAEYH